MKKAINFISIFIISYLIICCISSEHIRNEIESNNNTEQTLQNALLMAIYDIKNRIPQNSIIAIINFDTTSLNFSNYSKLT